MGAFLYTVMIKFSIPIYLGEFLQREQGGNRSKQTPTKEV